MKLSVVILAKNEEDVIVDCLESIQWADEVVLLDYGSIDNTVALAKRYPVRASNKEVEEMDFATWRNQGKEEAKGDWIFYLDADERVTPELESEIKKTIDETEATVLAIPRRNFLLGKELKHGGWYPDYQIRIFKKDKLKRWIGKLHERPEFEGEIQKLKSPMVHLQPETIEPALEKSIKWSGIEAKLLFDARHPRITWWRILRMGATTLFERLIKKQGFRDGTEGWIESLYQSFHTMIVYIKLWEMQKEK